MSAVTTRVIVLVGLALLLLLGGQAIDAGYTDAGNYTEIENETWTPDPGNVTELNHSKKSEPVRYDANVTVYNDSDPSNGSQMTEPDDYTWFESNGTILTNGTDSELDNGKDASIYYNFTTWTESENGTKTVISHALEGSQLLILVALVALLAAGVRVLTGVG